MHEQLLASCAMMVIQYLKGADTLLAMEALICVLTTVLHIVVFHI